LRLDIERRQIALRRLAAARRMRRDMVEARFLLVAQRIVEA